MGHVRVGSGGEVGDGRGEEDGRGRRVNVCPDKIVCQLNHPTAPWFRFV